MLNISAAATAQMFKNKGMGYKRVIKIFSVFAVHTRELLLDFDKFMRIGDE